MRILNVVYTMWFIYYGATGNTARHNYYLAPHATWETALAGLSQTDLQVCMRVNVCVCVTNH